LLLGGLLLRSFRGLLFRTLFCGLLC
jgi:hypothetical protein